ncbi:MAG: TIGR00269 family protein [Sulfolobaceae archaeon]
MRCSKCQNKAIISIKYAGLYLCKEHLNEWLESRVQRTIEKYKMISKNDVVAVAVSGGKDSTTLLHVLHKLSNKMGFEIIGLNIDLGIDGGYEYSKKSTEIARKNFEMLGIKYRIIRLKEEFGFGIDDTKNKTSRPVCSTCGIVKRYLLNRFAKEMGANVLATGHNLNDIAQFILAGYVNGDVNNLSKLSPVLPAEFGFIKKIKPLFLIPEKEIMTYAISNNIQFVYDSCPHTFRRIGGVMQTSIRRSLEELEERVPGIMLRLVENFEEKIRPLLEIRTEKEELNFCKECGMPTSKGRELCSFCAIRSKLTKQSLTHVQ